MTTYIYEDVSVNVPLHLMRLQQWNISLQNVVLCFSVNYAAYKAEMGKFVMARELVDFDQCFHFKF